MLPHLPQVNVLDGSDATEHNADADDEARDESRYLVTVDESEEDDTCSRENQVSRAEW